MAACAQVAELEGAGLATAPGIGVRLGFLHDQAGIRARDLDPRALARAQDANHLTCLRNVFAMSLEKGLQKKLLAGIVLCAFHRRQHGSLPQQALHSNMHAAKPSARANHFAAVLPVSRKLSRALQQNVRSAAAQARSVAIPTERELARVCIQWALAVYVR